MLVYKVEKINKNYIESNFCDAGLYIEVGIDKDFWNIIIKEEDARGLMEYLKFHLESEKK